MEQARQWMWTRTRYCSNYGSSGNGSGGGRFLVGPAGSIYESWEEKAFAEDAAGGHLAWPPRSYSCGFCRREFRSAQALGGHMNVHRRDRARLRQLSCSSSSSLNLDGETSTAAAIAGEVDLPRRPDETVRQAPPPGNANYSCPAAPRPSRVSAQPKSALLMQEMAMTTTAKESVVIRSTASTDVEDVEESSALRRRMTVLVDGEEELSSCSNKRRRTSEQQQAAFYETLLLNDHNAVEELDLELRLASGGLKI